MSLTETHYPHAILLPQAVGGPTEIVQLSDVSPNQNFQDLVEHASGDPLPSHTGSHGAQPALEFGSTQIKDILDDLSSNNLSVDYTSIGNVDVEYREALDGGDRHPIATATHVRARMEANAMLSFMSLRASHGELAELRARLFPRWDGVNNPIVWVDAVAATATTKIQSLYTLGPVNINGTLLGGVESIDWNNNLVFDEVASDGDPFASHAAIETSRTGLTIRTRKTSAMATHYDHTAVTSVIVYLRKKLASGYNVADATPEHIALTISAGTIKGRSVQGEKSVAELHVQAAQSSGVLFSINTASAIS